LNCGLSLNSDNDAEENSGKTRERFQHCERLPQALAATKLGCRSLFNVNL
jgi:hypothetical protein